MPPSAATIAAAQGDLPSLEALAEQGSALLLEVDAAVGATPLHVAARRGQHAAAAWLIEVRRMSRAASVPCQLTCAVTRCVRQHGASVGAVDASGANPLACAVASEDLPTFRAVLAGAITAAVTATDSEGLTALHEAAGLPHLGAALVPPATPFPAASCRRRSLMKPCPQRWSSCCWRRLPSRTRGATTAALRSTSAPPSASRAPSAPAAARRSWTLARTHEARRRASRLR